MQVKRNMRGYQHLGPPSLVTLGGEGFCKIKKNCKTLYVLMHFFIKEPNLASLSSDMVAAPDFLA